MIRVRRKRWIRTISYDPNCLNDSLVERNLSQPAISTNDDLYEIQSNDEDEDDDDIMNPFHLGARHSSISNEFSNKIFHDNEITSIGKKIKSIESDIKRDDEAEAKHWTQHVKPVLKLRVDDLTAKIQRKEVDFQNALQNGT